MIGTETTQSNTFSVPVPVLCQEPILCLFISKVSRTWAPGFQNSKNPGFYKRKIVCNKMSDDLTGELREDN